MNTLKKTVLSLALLLSTQATLNADVLTNEQLNEFCTMAKVDLATISEANFARMLSVGCDNGRQSFQSTEDTKVYLMANAAQLLEITRLMEREFAFGDGFTGQMAVFALRCEISQNMSTVDARVEGQKRLEAVAQKNFEMYKALKAQQ